MPFGPAIVTNCGIERTRARWLHQWDEQHVLPRLRRAGHNPYTPIRFCCRPEATLLTLRPARPEPRSTGPGTGMLGRLHTGVWRSLVARFVRDEEAAGSNPVTPTKTGSLEPSAE